MWSAMEIIYFFLDSLNIFYEDIYFFLDSNNIFYDDKCPHGFINMVKLKKRLQKLSLELVG